MTIEATEGYARLQAAYRQSVRYARDLRRLYQRLEQATYQSLIGLANALEAKDPYTRGHSDRVAAVSEKIAHALGLRPAEVATVGRAGLLHDIGKIGVPEATLRKSGPLDEHEWSLMRRHAPLGAEIVAPLDFLGEGARMIRHHHERCDGTGYPDGLRADAIPLGARIIAVADVYDALTSARPYRRALRRAEAVGRLLDLCGVQLDSAVVAAAIAVLPEP